MLIQLYIKVIALPLINSVTPANTQGTKLSLGPLETDNSWLNNPLTFTWLEIIKVSKLKLTGKIAALSHTSKTFFSFFPRLHNHLWGGLWLYQNFTLAVIFKILNNTRIAVNHNFAILLVISFKWHKLTSIKALYKTKLFSLLWYFCSNHGASIWSRKLCTTSSSDFLCWKINKQFKFK